MGQCLPSPGRLAGPRQGRGSLNLTPFLSSKIEGPSALTSRGSIHGHLLRGSPAQSHGEHKEPPAQVSEQRGLSSGPGRWLFCGCSDVSVDQGREYLLLSPVIQTPSTLHRFLSICYMPDAASGTGHTVVKATARSPLRGPTAGWGG